MPGPAVITGLVVGAVLGVSAFCLGTYLIHRYMDLQCRKIDRWFNRNALYVGRSEDLEKGSRAEMTRDVKKRKRSEQEQRTSNSTGPGEGDGENGNEARLRGGNSHDQWDVEEQDRRQMQPYMPQPPPALVQPTIYPRVLGWEHRGGPYDQLWQSPAVFQRAVPGTWYAYVPPQPRVSTYHQQYPYQYSNLHGRTPGLNDQYGARNAQLNRRDHGVGFDTLSEPRLAKGANLVERNSLQIVGKYPSFVEEDIKQRRRRERRRRRARARMSSSTDSRTDASCKSTSSVEDIWRDDIPDGVPHHADAASYNHSTYQHYARRVPRVQKNEGSHALRTKNSHRKQDRNDDTEMKSESKRGVDEHGKRQASNALPVRCKVILILIGRSSDKPAPKPRTQDRASQSDAISESRYNGEGCVQACNAA